jgi:hypothetical protein
MAAARTTVSTPTGTLTKKIQRQPSQVTTIPPMVGPAMVARPATPPQMPMAAPRRVAGKAAMMTAIVCGSSSAEPRPWTARAAISSVAVWARPQVAEATVKTATPAMNRFRRPRRSPSRPAVIISTASTMM